MRIHLFGGGGRERARDVRRLLMVKYDRGLGQVVLVEDDDEQDLLSRTVTGHSHSRLHGVSLFPRALRHRSRPRDLNY